MLRLASDANFNWRILRGLALRVSSLDLVTARMAGLMREPDEGILEWAAKDDRVLLTHDARTMPTIVYARIEAGLRMPGVLLVTGMSVGEAIERLRIFIEAGKPGDLEGRIERL